MADSEWTTLPFKDRTPFDFLSDDDRSRATTWLQKYLREFWGIELGELHYTPNTNDWTLYDKDNQFLTRLDHALMERLILALERLEWMDMYQESIPESDDEEPDPYNDTKW